LHWVGAAVGTGIGLHKGWKAAQRERPIHRAVRGAVALGFVLGLVLGGALCFVQGWLMAAVFVPSLLLLPPIAAMLIAPAWTDARLKRLYRRERATLVGTSRAELPQQGAFRTAAITVPPRAIAPQLASFETFCPACWHPLGEGEVVLTCPACERALDAPKFAIVREGRRLALHAGLRAFGWSTGLSIVGYAVMALVFKLFV
jgi:hypothetical protein